MASDEHQLTEGLYERVITSEVVDLLSAIPQLKVQKGALHSAEAPNRIALHLARQIEAALASFPEKERVERGVELVRLVLQQVTSLTSYELASEELSSPAEVLHAILALQPDGLPRQIDRPFTPLLDTTLLTNSPGEPRVGHEVKAEIASADEICVVMAFIRQTGIAPLLESLRRHREAGRRIRVLTTTYTGSTERTALDKLVEVGAEIRVSYDTSSTRLHAKAWLFERRSGFSTAYVGSSNLTFSAQVDGLEWNVRASSARNADVIDKVRAVFESYWEHQDFVDYDAQEFDARTKKSTADGPLVYLSPIAVTALPFQQRLLELVALSREQGHHRNLIAAATGTGKTVMAALDYARLRTTLKRSRLLFIAHRQEILDQSQATFRHVLREPSFGEQWIGGKKPSEFEHVFASIQTLSKVALDTLDPSHFDVVIVDEFHHAAASSYQGVLEHLRPVELVGLTATPERADGLPVLHWFGDRIAAELRLWDAIDQQYLVPFLYYGIHDGLDLRDVPWTRGKGYDIEGLTNLYTASDVWAKQVIKEFVNRSGDPALCRALGFCVSIEHAKYMARMFRDAGIASAAVSGETDSDERRAVLKRLATGEFSIVFSVDLFNEGVDVPNVNTLLLMRPTESATLFLQQLGRGLRRAEGKTVCTVLDFVGTHRKEFRFDQRFGALLRGTRKELVEQVENGFPYLPAGCHMELDAVAAEIVLAGLRDAIPSKWPQKVEELRRHVAQGADATLASFLEHSGLALADVYDGGKTWSDLCDAAGVPTLPAGPSESVLRKAVSRMTHVDDHVRLEALRELVASTQPVRVAEMDAFMSRLTRMAVSQLVGEVSLSELAKGASLQDGVDYLWRHPQVLSELAELADLLEARIDHLHRPLVSHPAVPLQVHARYSRLEILAAFGHQDGARAASWQSGVLWLPNESVDLFAFTLDKTSGHFSPTTRYRDYAISPTLVHWESQSATRADSPTGVRYRQHEDLGSSVVLFARLRQSDREFWCLGPATYVKHQGERPMAITWRLHEPLPGDLFVQFAAAAG